MFQVFNACCIAEMESLKKILDILVLFFFNILSNILKTYDPSESPVFLLDMGNKTMTLNQCINVYLPDYSSSFHLSACTHIQCGLLVLYLFGLFKYFFVHVYACMYLTSINRPL